MLEATVALELILGKRAEAVILGALLLFNGFLSLLQERKAANALALLRKSLPVRARVMRDGEWQVIDSQEIVVGDAIYLRMGDIVPADARIADGQISVDQSTLTGESQPVDLAGGQTAHAGATVVRGEASAEVIATGKNTSFGKTAELVSTAKTVSHLEAIIFRIVKYLVILDLALVAALVVFAWVTGLPLREMIPFGLILLIASVPAALPATFTLATALGSMELTPGGRAGNAAFGNRGSRGDGHSPERQDRHPYRESIVGEGNRCICAIVRSGADTRRSVCERRRKSGPYRPGNSAILRRTRH